MNFPHKVISAIELADANGTTSQEEVEVVLSGLSGKKLIGSLQRLARLFEEDEKACYTEIGVYQGLTLLSVASAAPKLACFGIDNYSQHDPGKKNLSMVKERQVRLGLKNAELVNMDYEEAFFNFEELSGGKKIGVLFVDGPHDYRAQMVSILFAKKHLHENCVVVVDDSNYQHVRQANHDFLRSHPDFKLIFESYTPTHPLHQTRQEQENAREGWWNGINILARDTLGQVETILPPLAPHGKCFSNDHLVHSHRYGEFAPNALNFMRGLEQPWRFPVQLARLIRQFSGFQDSRSSETLEVNTFSRSLPTRYANLK